MQYLFKLAIKNIFIRPKSIQYKHGEMKSIDQPKEKDKTLLESLYAGRVNADDIFHKSARKRDGGRQT